MTTLALTKKPTTMTQTWQMNKVLMMLVLGLLLGACSSTPDGIIPEEKMARLLADVHQAEGVVETERGYYSSDSMRRVLRKSVYERHGVTAEQVDSSMVWYGRNIEKYIDVYSRVIEILDERLLEANTLSAREGGEMAQASMAVEGDSVDVWTTARQRRFYTLGANNYVTYRLNADNHWEPNDRFTLSFKALNPRSPVSVTLTAEYDNGSTEVVSRSVSQQGWSHISIDVEGEDLRSGIRGRHPRALAVAIGYTPDRDEQMYIDSISLVRVHPRITRASAVGHDDDTTRLPQPVSGVPAETISQ